LNVANESLRDCMPSILSVSASVSSTNSDIAGSRNPRPCGASGYAPDRERANSEPCETRRRGVRWGVGFGIRGQGVTARDDIFLLQLFS
jgi:hypothetical protein